MSWLKKIASVKHQMEQYYRFTDPEELAAGADPDLYTPPTVPDAPPVEATEGPLPFYKGGDPKFRGQVGKGIADSRLTTEEALVELV